MSERLAELLRDAADTPEPLQVQDITRRVRLRRRRRTTLAAALTAAAVAAVVVPLTVAGTPTSHPVSLTATPPPATPGLTVTLGNVSVTTPPDWTQASASCGQARLTVGVEPRGDFYRGGPVSCPTSSAGAPSITLVRSAPLQVREESENQGPSCRRENATVIDGLPAAVVTPCDVAADEPIQGRVLFDLVDTSVLLSATSMVDLQTLVSWVHVQPAAGLDLPAQADSVFVTSAGYINPPLVTGGTISDPSDVSRLLADLRAAPLLPPSTPICEDEISLRVEPSTGQQLDVSLGSCNQIVSGNGTLARATPAVRADLAAVITVQSP